MTGADRSASAEVAFDVDVALAVEATARLLTAIDPKPDRAGLRETPLRVALAWKEVLSGYKMSPREILSRDFEAEGYSGMVVVGPVDFYSTCEHHLLQF